MDMCTDLLLTAPTAEPAEIRRPGMPWRWPRAVMLLFVPMLLCSNGQQRDAEKDTTAVVQASYIYNIAKLVEWRDASMRSGNFVVGIIGGANLYQELIKKYATKTIGKQQVEVRKLLDLGDANCHMLFVGKEHLTCLLYTS